ncbi:MAG TPA: hypothetical protein GXX36_10480 [Clostridiaceae bacterium]|nr:hypothetical protein [Clostridiaceae bacterium]
MYTRVESRFWQDEKMRTISDDARYLMLYFLTSPHRNIMGFYFLPSPYACFDLGWDEKRFQKALQELLQTGCVKYDACTHVVLIQNYLKHNPLENPNQVKSAIEKFSEMPQTPLFQDFLTILEQFNKPFMKPLIERLKERLGKPVTVSVTVSEIERYIDAHVRENTSQESNQEGIFKTEIQKINDKALEYGMTGITPEFIEDAEMRLSEGTDVELIIKALAIGATKAKGNAGAKCRYAISVLQGWATEGIRTLAQWEAKNTPEPKARDKPKIQDMTEIKQDKYERAKQKALQMLREKGVISSDGS